jgi:hypothetical protein
MIVVSTKNARMVHNFDYKDPRQPKLAPNFHSSAGSIDSFMHNEMAGGSRSTIVRSK